MSDDIRQRYAEALARQLPADFATTSRIPAAAFRLAYEVMAVRDEEMERLRAIVTDYENTISWDTTCREHARLLDECRRQEERAEQAEAALAAARNLCARSPLCVPEDARG